MKTFPWKKMPLPSKTLACLETELSVDLACRTLDDQDVRAACQALKINSTLQQLDLQGATVTDEDFLLLVASISHPIRVCLDDTLLTDASMPLIRDLVSRGLAHRSPALRVHVLGERRRSDRSWFAFYRRLKVRKCGFFGCSLGLTRYPFSKKRVTAAMRKPKA